MTENEKTGCGSDMMSLMDRLRVDPAEYVLGVESPIGIYLRREILKKEKKSDSKLEKEIHEKMVAGQSVDGSWNQLFVETANNLWNLALLGYDEASESVDKGLKWLLSNQTQYRGYPGFFCSSNRKDPSLMRSTFYGEFGPGCTIFYQTAYVVHLFHIFGLDNDKHIQTTVKSYLRFWRPDWCGAWCTINVLRILVEHPLSSGSEQVGSGLKHLAATQSKMGAWKGFPFFHTFHALSRSHNVLANRQFEKAAQLVVKRQNRDGSWGKKAVETETFLVLDALKNSGNSV